MRDRSAGNINNVFIYSMYCLGMTWPIAAHRGCHDSPRRLFWPLGALLRADDALPCAHLIQCVCFERRRVGQEPRRTFAACPRLLRETFLDPNTVADAANRCGIAQQRDAELLSVQATRSEATFIKELAGEVDLALRHG